ncbi:glycohydrolase toxin TNT-related protein [Citrobacter amalonaticus]|nr:DUF4150 domain-containing protein [Citrobacter amalonaticus]
MADNVAARQATGWVVVCTTPDVCKTPMGPSTPPVPYRVTAQLADAVQVVPTVNANGRPLVVLTQSFIPKTVGDEPGVAKGVQSGTVADICEPLEHSSSVKAGGYCTLRHDDQFYMNNKNTVGKIVGQTPSAGKSASDSNPEVVPETPEEKEFWKTLIDSLNQETDSRVAAIRNLNDVLGDSPPAIPPPKGLASFSILAAVTNPQIPSDVFRKIAANGGPEEQAVFDHVYDKYGGALTALSSVGLMYVSGGGAAGLKGPALAEGRGLINMETRLTDEGASLIDYSKVRPEGGVIVTGEGAELTAGKTAPPGETRPGMQVKKAPPPEQPDESNKPSIRNCSTEGEPVDMVTGDFLQHLSILTVPGTLPLTLTRLYRSRADAGGLFGPKWTDEWSQFIEPDPHARKIHFTDHEGVTLTYPLPDNGLLTDAVNSRVSSYVLSGDVNGELSVFDRRSRRHLVFGEQQGTLRRLSAIRDGYGNTVTFVYRDERLVQVRHSGGYVLDLDWLNGQLASITLTMQEKTQRLVTCRYDGQGMLAECDSFQFAHTWHRYNPKGQMVFWRDEDGTQVDLCYDARGRVTETKTPEGYYNDRFIYNDAERQNTYVDAEGGLTHYWYNDDGLATRRTDPLGREELTEWENSRRKTVTDALGRVTAWEYNRYGDITRLSLPGGEVLRYRYDDSGNLIRFQGPGNKIWQFDYDEHGGLQTITDPQGRQSSRLYGEHGELLQQVLPDGDTWHYGYDPFYRLNRVSGPLEGETLLSQDMLGRLLTVRAPLNLETAWQHSTQHASPGGSATKVTLPDGVEQQQDYGAGKKVASVTDGEGKITRYEYGSFDLLTAVVRPDGQRYGFAYDGLLRLKQVTNAEGKHWQYDYDAAGQLIRETDFSGRTLRYDYDAAGRRICTRYPDAQLARCHYDDGDRLFSQQVLRLQDGAEKLVSTTEYRYDSEYRLVSATTPDAQVAFEYDADGHVIAESINGRRVEQDYDALSGRPVAWRLDGVAMCFAHGPAGLLKEWQVDGHAPLQLSHDALGRETERRSEAGFLSGRRHGATGNLMEQWAGRLAVESGTVSQDVYRQMEYDRAYNVTHITDGRWGKTDYRYDVNEQITRAEGGVRTLPREETFSYDENLNVRQYGHKPNRPFEAMTFTKYEQQSGRVIKRGEDDYRYDDSGRLVEKTVLTDGFRPQRWRYRWDVLGQLSELITPQGERWTYCYDAFGRRISKRRQGTAKGTVGYDYQWCGDQLVAETPVYADGTAATGESVYWLYEPGALTPGARYEKGLLHYVVRDHMGTPRELLTESGEVVWSQKLSVWGRSERYRFGGWNAANDEGGPDCPWRFAGQWEDEESGLYYNRFRYYDSDAGQYLTPDPIGLKGGINPYGYVKNPLKWIDPLGLCKDGFDKQKVLDNIAASVKARESSNFRNFNEWPSNRGFLGESSEFTLLPGTRIDRYGSEYGTFVSPEGVPYRARSLKPGTDGRPYNVYEVMEPITVNAGDAAPWFGYEGGGAQYELPSRVTDLLRNGSLERR